MTMKRPKLSPWLNLNYIINIGLLFTNYIEALTITTLRKNILERIRARELQREEDVPRPSLSMPMYLTLLLSTRRAPPALSTCSLPCCQPTPHGDELIALPSYIARHSLISAAPVLPSSTRALLCSCLHRHVKSKPNPAVLAPHHDEPPITLARYHACSSPAASAVPSWVLLCPMLLLLAAPPTVPRSRVPLFSMCSYLPRPHPSSSQTDRVQRRPYIVSTTVSSSLSWAYAHQAVPPCPGSSPRVPLIGPQSEHRAVLVSHHLLCEPVPKPPSPNRIRKLNFLEIRWIFQIDLIQIFIS